MKYKTVQKLKDNMLLSCKVLSSSRILLRSGAFLGSCALLGSCAHSDKELPLNIVLINLDDAGNGDFSFKELWDIKLPISTNWRPKECP